MLFAICIECRPIPLIISAGGDPSHSTFTVLRTVEAICRLADRLKRE